ncbi:DUF6461 domain-containing protein [Streptomyces sp. cg2]|uniref:DUF6461 domain-containing protein n=1 Tax=Streptomyces sp. cg2 TaxID=3238799 RepID=UPI0034E21F45
MRSATAADFGWIRPSSWFEYALEVGHTLTLVRGCGCGSWSPSRPGRVRSCTRATGHSLRRYPNVTVDKVDSPRGARFVFTGAGAEDLHFNAGDVLRGTNRVD